MYRDNINSAEEEALKNGNIRVYTVSEINEDLKNLIERNYAKLWVEGEISNLSVPMSGHAYWTLKDETSQIKVVMFRDKFSVVGFQIEQGMKVIVYGQLTIYVSRGEHQIIAEQIVPKGIGILQMRFEQLKKKLAAEGLFDPARKRQIPFLPKCIGIVTSPVGAALRDILKILERRYRNLRIIIYAAKVQGEGAAEEIAEGIRYLNTIKGIDVLIVGRGGGSLEDLWAFNEECVARAIFNSQIPVISAVGHEVDFTIADFVADLRAPTPSAAAELVVRNREDLMGSVKVLEGRFIRASLNYIGGLRNSVQLLAHKLIDPRKKFSEIRERLDDIAGRLLFGIKKIIEVRREILFGRAQNINSLSPLAVLDRGYSITFKEKTSEVVKNASQVSIGESLLIKLMKGELICEVKKIKE
jgi:exodeoxyribonuclease VII large subunit